MVHRGLSSPRRYTFLERENNTTTGEEEKKQAHNCVHPEFPLEMVERGNLSTTRTNHRGQIFCGVSKTDHQSAALSTKTRGVWDGYVLKEAHSNTT